LYITKSTQIKTRKSVHHSSELLLGRDTNNNYSQYKLQSPPNKLFNSDYCTKTTLVFTQLFI